MGNEHETEQEHAKRRQSKFIYRCQIYFLQLISNRSIFLVDDVQVSCYRILTSLYALGTGKNIYVERYPKVKCCIH